MATRAEGRADVASQRADVGALAADHTDLDLREGVVEQLDLVDDEGLSLELEVPALAGQVVGTAAIYLDRREGGRHLLDGADEALESLFDGLAGDMLCGEVGIRRRLHVEGRGRLPEADVCDILLAPSLQLVDALGMLAGAEDHHAGGERVECTCVTYLKLLDAEVAAGFAAKLID